MRIGRALAVAGLSWFGGLGGGFAALGEWERALAWLATLPVAALLGVLVSPWCLMLLFVVVLASMVHAIVRASRTDVPLRVMATWPVTIFMANLAVALVLRGVIVEAFKIPSSSMYPTLHIGDHIFVDKLTPHFRAIARGEVVVYRFPCDPTRAYVHRVVAIAGDTVEVRCNVLHVNGKPVANQLVEGATCSYQDYDAQEDRWYAMACSRYHESLDGRAWDVFHDPDRPARDASPPTHGDARDFPKRDQLPSCANNYDGGPRTGAPVGNVVETKPEAQASPCEPQLHYVVPADHVFVLGDNRNNANDSRIWGALPVVNVRGRLLGIWWSRELGRVGPVH